MRGLTKKQKADRLLGIGGSDAKTIMSGDWDKLWQIKTGRIDDDDLSDVFVVQLGHVTEKFNIEWLFKNKPSWSPVSSADYPEVSAEWAFMRCNADAVAQKESGQRVIIDAKHTNGWTDRETLFDRYYWQLTHNAIVTGCEDACITAIGGNNWLKPIEWQVNQDDAARLITAEKLFWWHVESDTPPEREETPAIPMISITEMKEQSFEGNNEWADLAVEYLDNAGPHKVFQKSEKALKKMVPDDVRLATGHGIQIKRAKNMALTIKVTKEDASEAAE